MNDRAPASRVFLSYNRLDTDAARELSERMRDAGHEVFLDQLIPFGARWQEQLENKLRWCTRFVLLAADRETTDWIQAECSAALTLHFQSKDRKPDIWPILLDNTPPAALPLFYRAFNAICWAPGRELPPNAAVVPAQQDGAADRLSLCPGQSPYRGLAPFGREDNSIFFGRGAETLFVLKRLGALGDSSTTAGLADQLSGRVRHPKWMQVEGSSGCGKSSLVMAGIVPQIESGALRERGIHKWHVLGPWTPGLAPYADLVACIQAWHASVEPGGPIAERLMLRDRLNQPDGVASVLAAVEPGEGFLLIVDQFEQLLVASNADERRLVDAQLADALEDRHCPLLLLSTVRADFLDRMHEVPRLAAYLSTKGERYLLPAVDELALREIVETRSRLAQVHLGDLGVMLIDDARDEPGALPLVENALRVLWKEAKDEQRGRGGGDDEPVRLSRRRYAEGGRLVGLLEKSADGLLDQIGRSLGASAKVDALEILLSLTRINPEGQHTRRHLGRSEVLVQGGKHGEQVLRKLSGEASKGDGSAADSIRLVSIEGAPEGGEATVSLIHETLVRTRQMPSSPKPYWETLYRYVGQNLGRDLLKQELEARSRRWQAAPAWRRWTRLAFGSRLWAFRRLRYGPDRVEQRFLRASRVAAAFGWAGLFAAAGSSGLYVRDLALWLDKYHLPVSYAAKRIAWQLGHVPLPSLMPVPAATQSPLSTGFEIGETEITFEEYDYFVWSLRHDRDPPASPKDTLDVKRGSYPVINVSWAGAKRYAQWLSAKTGQDWRLPSASQWQRAADAAAEAGASGPQGGWQGRARCHNCGRNADEKGPHPVGSYPEDGLKLRDMAGNVAEWVISDGGDESVAGSPERRCRPPSREHRGGGWVHPQVEIGPAAWGCLDAPKGVDWVGFRVVRLPRKLAAH